MTSLLRHGVLDGLLTAEKERNMRREHARLHPDGLMRSGKVCDVCLLLAALSEAYRRIPRCTGSTPQGYRCARPSHADGRHSHPKDDLAPHGLAAPVGAFFERAE